MKSLLAQLKDLGDHLRYATRNEASIDKALKQVYAILVSITQELGKLEQKAIVDKVLNVYSTKHIKPYDPGVGSVCGSETIPACTVQQPIGEDEQD